MPRTSNGNKTSENVSKSEMGTTSNVRSITGNKKKQEPVNIKVPTAREKAKNFDEGRRNDAFSNEM